MHKCVKLFSICDKPKKNLPPDEELMMFAKTRCCHFCFSMLCMSFVTLALVSVPCWGQDPKPKPPLLWRILLAFLGSEPKERTELETRYTTLQIVGDIPPKEIMQQFEGTWLSSDNATAIRSKARPRGMVVVATLEWDLPSKQFVSWPETYHVRMIGDEMIGFFVGPSDDEEEEQDRPYSYARIILKHDSVWVALPNPKMFGPECWRDGSLQPEGLGQLVSDGAFERCFDEAFEFAYKPGPRSK